MEAGGLRIRRATVADAASLSAVAARWFEETFGPQNDPEDMRLYMEKAFSEGQQAAELSDPWRVTLLVEEDGELAGYAYLRRTPPDAAHPGVPTGEAVEIQRFYVGSGHHGRGVAARLMEAAMETARGMGGELLWLGVWEHNTRAIRFYRKHGFEDVGEQDFLLGTDLQHDRVMTRPL
jgi:ribosomal protein S18 acetylase RimI-like enzyme